MTFSIFSCDPFQRKRTLPKRKFQLVDKVLWTLSTSFSAIFFRRACPSEKTRYARQKPEFSGILLASIEMRWGLAPSRTPATNSFFICGLGFVYRPKFPSSSVRDTGLYYENCAQILSSNVSASRTICEISSLDTAS